MVEQKRYSPMPTFSESHVNAFWSKVAFTANPSTCWSWTARTDKDGYGKYSIKIEKGRNGKTRAMVSTRVSYLLHYKVDPLDKMVLHKCDNPNCINPAHLFLGTAKENTADMFRKNRQGKHLFKGGETVPGAKLTDAKIIEIRKAYSTGEIQRSIARRFGMSPSAINQVVNNKSWTHVNNLKQSICQ